MQQLKKLSLPVLANGLNANEASIFFIGTATTLIRIGGFTILTDPNFLHAGSHVHLGYGLTAKRLTEPAVDIMDLPPLDLCILSHMHGDHWDKIASASLRKTLPIVTTSSASRRLSRKGFRNTVPLDKWERLQIQKPEATPLSITSMPGKHGPGLMNYLLPPVMGSLIEVGTEPRFRLYISGDTLVTDDLREIPQRYKNIDLMLIHLGGTRALGLLVTMDAEQGIRALQIIQPREAIPIHYNDYDRFKSPLEDFIRLVDQSNLTTKLTYLRHGESYAFSLPDRVIANERAETNFS